MSLTTLVLQIILTIPLTIILSYFQNKENRKVNQILIPTIYITIIAAILPTIKDNIFLIVVFEIFIRNFYISNFFNSSNKISNGTFIIESLISICLSLFTYNYFISKVDSVIPNPEDIKAFVWFLIIIFICYLYKISTKEKVASKKLKINKQSKEKNIMQYAKYKNLYANLIKSKNNIINNIIYSIIIYNEYKTPIIYRQIKEKICSITKTETLYGIMEIKSQNKITNEESILISITDFEKRLKNTKLKEAEQIEELLKKYSDNEKECIVQIYSDIKEFSKK